MGGNRTWTGWVLASTKISNQKESYPQDCPVGFVKPNGVRRRIRLIVPAPQPLAAVDTITRVNGLYVMRIPAEFPSRAAGCVEIFFKTVLKIVVLGKRLELTELVRSI